MRADAQKIALSEGGGLKTNKIAILRTNNQQLTLYSNLKYLVVKQTRGERVAALRRRVRALFLPERGSTSKAPRFLEDVGNEPRTNQVRTTTLLSRLLVAP
jgi:hypothetical protein